MPQGTISVRGPLRVVDRKHVIVVSAGWFAIDFLLPYLLNFHALGTGTLGCSFRIVNPVRRAHSTGATSW